MKNSYLNIIKRLGKNRVQLNEPLDRHTYIKIGGPADLFFIANNLEELTSAVRSAIKEKIDLFVLGGGSNILVSDKGYRGLVIKNRADKISFHKFTGKVHDKKAKIDAAEITAESGAITNLLVRRSIQEGLEGLEYFLGVPGTLGGAIYNNSHYQQQLIGDVVHSVQVLDNKGKEKVYTKEQMQFSYDYSILHKTKEIVLSVTFRLQGQESQKLWRKAELFARNRSETQPLNFPSSGCMFKNPEKEKDNYTDTKSKLSAGYLIDKVGLKGTKIGNIKVSEKHANFMVNIGGATAKDVLKLVKLVQDKVNKKFGIKLEMEVFKVGEF